jgi:hypothetical protein
MLKGLTKCSSPNGANVHIAASWGAACQVMGVLGMQTNSLVKLWTQQNICQISTEANLHILYYSLSPKGIVALHISSNDSPRLLPTL